MDNLEPIVGPSLALRLIRPEDAEYVHGLRTDPRYNRHLSPVVGTPEDQRRWITGYKDRESAGKEFYFIAERLDGLRCGTVRLYDIGRDSFVWGSWIMDHNKPRKAALECAMLSFGFGFANLDLNVAKVDVRIENTHAEAFYRRLGMHETHRTEQDIYLEYPRSRFEADLAGYLSIIRGNAP